MATKCVFVCGLHNIDVKEDLKDGILLSPNEKNVECAPIKITNNRAKIRSLLSKDLLYLIGAIEVDHLANGYPMVAYAESEFEENMISSIQYLDQHLTLLKMYFFCLWMTKDNAADFDIGFLQFTDNMGHTQVSANNMTTTNFKASGDRNSTEFTVDDLILASNYLKDCIYIESASKPKLASASSLNRISIANYFIQSAIVALDLGIKSVGYCSALETLFANGDNTELAHKLSERASKFLEDELDKRLNIYRIVKKIYEIRSKVVHGATFKSQKEGEISELIREADGLCRRIMIYALTTPEKENIFNKTKDQLDTFFLELALK